jgi:hypothetical protein
MEQEYHHLHRWRMKMLAARKRDVGQPGLRSLKALDVLGLQPFFAGNDLEGDDVAFIEGFKAGSDNRRMMDENVLTRFLGDEAETFLIVEPLYLATCHIDS